MTQIYFKDEWLMAARTLEGEACGLFLEAVISYQITKRWPPRDLNPEAMGAFKVVKEQIDRLNLTGGPELLGEDITWHEYKTEGSL